MQVKYSSQKDPHRKVYSSRLLRALRFARCFKKSASNWFLTGRGDLYCLNTFNRKCLLPTTIFHNKWRALITKPQLSKKEPITYREFEPKDPKFKKRFDYRLEISSFNLNFTDLMSPYNHLFNWN